MCGAGSHRSDPKAGNAADFPRGRGPQGDVIRINNLVRCVRGGVAEPQTQGPEIEMKRSRRVKTEHAMQQQGQGHPMMPPRMDGRPGQGPSAADFVQRLDRDGDGKVSEQEFDGPAQHFTQRDRNHDGYLSQSEAPQGPLPQRGQRRRR